MLRSCVIAASLVALVAAAPVPSTVILELPSGPLVDRFMPSPPGSFQRNQSYHCFTFGPNDDVNFVRGLIQGYWYFEGPVAADGTATLTLLANNPILGELPIQGQLTLSYAADFMSAKIVLAHCEQSSWCTQWPSMFVNGHEAFNANPASVCLWQAGMTRGGPDALTSKWTSEQGTTWMCKSPAGVLPNQVFGSWKYVNGRAECQARGEPYPCPNNYGPYSNDSVTVTLSDGGGILMSQWWGWNFGAQNYADGRSVFAAVNATQVSGSYCVYDDAVKKIAYCYAEGYSVVGSASLQQCAQYQHELNATSTA